MGIWNTLKDLTTNRKGFNSWEQTQEDIDVKRTNIYKTKFFSKEELDRAKKLGQTITDVVDVMDQHSEDVAEDVETATQPVTAFALPVGLGGAGFGFYKLYVKKNWKKYSGEIEKIIKENGLAELLEHINSTPNAVTDKIKGLPYELHRHEITNGFFNMNKRTLNKLNFADPQVKQKLIEIANKATTVHKNILMKPLSRSVWGTVAIGIAALIGTSVWATKAQIYGSRIGRYQARKKLENEKYFVQYTDEQVEQAKENLKMKKQEKKGLFSFLKKDKQESDGFWKNNFNVIRQYGEYKRWKASDSDDAKKVSRQLTPEEVKQAKADKEVIQRVVRKINNKAEEYSENMETAADTILLSSYLGGGLLGATATWILNKTGAVNRFLQNKITKVAGDEGTTLLKNIVENEKKPRSFLGKISNAFAGDSRKLFDLLKNQYTKIKPGAKFMNSAKAFLYTMCTTKFARNIAITGVGAVLAGIAGSFISLKLQKNASRAGRYIAKQELLNDPKNFIALDEKDLESKKNVKAHKPSLMQRMGNYIMFVPVSIKQCFQYEKYKKEKLQPARDLKEELIKLNVSKEQLAEAKNLQRKLFNTFEKVDDKSQEYSESMELANEVGQQLLSQLPTIVIYGVPFLIIGRMLSGKLSLGSLGKKILGGISSVSFLLKSKLSKKYLNQVSNKLTEIVTQTPKPETLFDPQMLCSLKKHIPNNINIASLLEKAKGSEFAELLQGVNQEAITKFLKVLKNIPDDKIAEYVTKSPKDLFRLLSGNPVIEKDLRPIAEFLTKIGNTKISGPKILLMKAALKTMKTGAKVSNWFTKANSTEKRIAEAILGMSDNSIKELSQLLDCLKGQNLADKLTLLKAMPNTNKLRNFLVYLTERLDKPLNAPLNLPEGLPNNAIGFIKKLIPNNNIINQITEAAQDHTKLINILRTKVNDMTEEQFVQLNQRIQRMCIKSPIEVGVANRAEWLASIGKLEKILNHLPKQELQNVFDTFMKLLNENPDKFLYLITKHPEKLYGALNTPVLQNTMLTLGISAATGMVGMTYIIASLLAKLQKDAGRYGVMRAMQELDDNAYYANTEPVIKKDNNTEVAKSSIPQVNQQTKTGDMMMDLLNKAKSKYNNQNVKA